MRSEGPDSNPVPLGLRWSIKHSFLQYIARMPDGRGSVSDGATAVGPNEMLFEPGPVIAPSSDDELTLTFRGDVRFAGHFGMLFVRIADPWVTVRDGSGEMTVIDPYRPEERPRLRLVTFDLQERPAAPGTLAWLGTDVRLAPEGTELFNDVYQPGEPFEPLSITLPANR